MPSEAQKRARDKWDATAKANGTTPSALIRGWIDAYMQKNEPAE